MPYATLSDLETRYGVDFAPMVVDSEDSAVISAAVDAALESASSEIDLYVARQYGLPLESTPPILVQICVDIAVYQLASSYEGAREGQRQRYEDAVALLDKIATDKIALSFTPPEDTGGEDGAAPVSAGSATLVSQTRHFTRDTNIF